MLTPSWAMACFCSSIQPSSTLTVACYLHYSECQCLCDPRPASVALSDPQTHRAVLQVKVPLGWQWLGIPCGKRNISEKVKKDFFKSVASRKGRMCQILYKTTMTVKTLGKLSTHNHMPEFTVKSVTMSDLRPTNGLVQISTTTEWPDFEHYFECISHFLQPCPAQRPQF